MRQATNATREYGLVLAGPGGSSLAGLFDGSETFAAKIWAGDDQATGATLSAAWQAGQDFATAPTLVVVLTVARAAIEALPPGRYYLQVILGPGVHDVHVVPPGTTIELTAAPGSGEAVPVYVSRQELLDECPWIEQVQGIEDQAGFAEQRGKAREWTDAAIQAAYRGGIGGDDWQDLVWGPGQGGTNPWLQARLDADALVLTTPHGKRIRTANAQYAIARVLRHQVGAREKTSYQALAQEFARLAERTLRGAVAEILAADGDAQPGIRVALGGTRILRG